MAKRKQKKSQTTKKVTRAKKVNPPVPRRFARYSLVLLLAGVAGIAWLSMVTFVASDPPSHSVSPANSPAQNAAGVVGAYLSYTLRYWVGSAGAYVALAMISLAAGVMLLGRIIRHAPWRVIGLVLLVLGASVVAYLIDHGEPDKVAEGSAGILGTDAGYFLLTKFGLWGSRIIAAIILLIGTLMAADEVVYTLYRLLRKIWSKRDSVGSAVTRVGNRASGVSGVSGRIDPKALRKKLLAKSATKPTKTRKLIQFIKKPPIKNKPTVKANASQKAALVTDASRASNTSNTSNTSDQQKYVLPSSNLLSKPQNNYTEKQDGHAWESRAILQETLTNFNVDAQVIGHMTGPCITMYELDLAAGVKVAKIASLSNDISRALAVPGVRIVSPIPGKDTVGIEVPNAEREMVMIRELMDLANGRDAKMNLPLYLGKDASAEPIIADLAAMPHMLLAGTTGSGKSVCINSIIMSILLSCTPEEVRFILVDPKMVELAAFENIPHLLCPIINDMRKAEDILEWAAVKMDERYELLKEARVRNIAGYNRLGPKELYDRLGIEDEEDRKRVMVRMPYYVIIIDELADLMMTSSKEVEIHIIRIAQKARAVGIHLVLATQRPSVDVVTGLIKSNMPCRLSFRVASRQESRIILDQNGAEILMGQGDMLFLQPGTSNVVRSQGTFVEDAEIHKVVRQLRKSGEPKYNTELIRMNSSAGIDGGGVKDDLFNKAAEIILVSRRGSVSLLQRKMQIGYTRAARIVDQLAEAGILGSHKGSQARECMITLEDWKAMQAGISADLSGESSFNGDPMSE